MPRYEYRCSDCKQHLEVVQKFTDDALTVCPECSGHLNKVFSAVGVVFKGSGFYSTDNRTKNTASPPAPSSTPSDSATSPDSSAAGSGSTKADTSSTANSASKSAPVSAASTSTPSKTQSSAA